MKKQIWKFLIRGSNSIHMPIGSEILTVQNQNEDAWIWALVDPEKEIEERFFEVYGTGHNIHYDMDVERKYIGTFQISGGSLVFHLFERIN